jgi:hypothetical protein
VLLSIDGSLLGTVYGVLVDVDVLLGGGTREVTVNRVLWSEALSVLALSNVNWVCVVLVVTIDLDAGVRKLGSWPDGEGGARVSLVARLMDLSPFFLLT